MEHHPLPVDVISLCSCGGEIRPLRIRLVDEEQIYQRIDIDEVISTKEIPYVGVEATIFLCRATVRGKQWLLELKYCFRSHSWYLLGRLA